MALEDYQDIAVALPADDMEYTDNGLALHKATEAVKEIILDNTGTLSPANNPFASTGISYVPVTADGRPAKFPLKIKAVPQNIIADISKRTIYQVRAPRKSQGLNKKTKQFEYYTDDRDPQYIDDLSRAVIEQRNLYIL